MKVEFEYLPDKNVTIWGHDMFRPNENKVLIAYCKLEFPENIKVHI